MKSYYASRAVIAALFGGTLVLAGSDWRVGILVGALVFAWFLAAPHLGRYTVNPVLGVAALQRDERVDAISSKAARNGFVVSMLAVGGVLIYASARSMTAVPLSFFSWLLVLGVLVYYASEFWLRRTQ